jgi:hypothetical protein
VSCEKQYRSIPKSDRLFRVFVTLLLSFHPVLIKKISKLFQLTSVLFNPAVYDLFM